MTDNQCGLCLSCGVPFLPVANEIDFFNREGNLSILFLNTEFKTNRDIMRMYEYPKFSSEREGAHMFHRSNHATAIQYMCERHTGDSDVGWLPGAGFPNAVIPDANNEAFLFYHAPTASDKKAGAACWQAPPRNERVNMRPLRDTLMRISRVASARPITQNLLQMYDTCEGCNKIMTQMSHMRFLLGFKSAGRKNTRGPIIRPNANGPISQYKVSMRRHDLDHAYGRWSLINGNGVYHPIMTDQDSDAPHIAYYLHLCLPFMNPGQPRDVFHGMGPNLRDSGRKLYLEQCWIILEIACLATLVQEGLVVYPNDNPSHGKHQQRGCLDLYVSFFLWRLAQFEFGDGLGHFSLDFIQWHQKYFADARNCKALFRPNERRSTIGELAFSTSNQNSKALVEQICRRLVNFYTRKLRNLVLFVANVTANLPPEITDYFLPLSALRVLRTKAGEVSGFCFYFFLTVVPDRLAFLQTVKNDFQSALGKFGISALLFRVIDLCAGYPASFFDQLLSFRSSWQWREIERVRLTHQGYSSRSAYRLYYLCTLLHPPDEAETPLIKELEDVVFQIRDYCSPWTSVLALDAIGAFRYQAVDVTLLED
jgi:hypothetical protein